MKNVLLINGHHYYPFSKGKLNAALAELTQEMLEQKGYSTKVVSLSEDWDTKEQLDLHTWADCIVLQFPVNWMGVPWPLKKYMDEVYTAGMGGTLCAGDGRSKSDPKAGYGTGGSLEGKKYMLSLTFNAPKEAFDNPDAYLFQGKSVDDLMFPTHMNFRFFAMEQLPTFACHDVMKNPSIEQDFEELKAHIHEHF